MKEWKIFQGDNCPNCGDAVEVLSEIAEEDDSQFETSVYDGEEVRCIGRCGFLSGIEVTEEGNAYIQEGNLIEL